MGFMVMTKDDAGLKAALLEATTGAAATATATRKSDSDAPLSADRRNSARYEVSWAVDCVGDDTFLFASLANISEMGIFVLTTEPLAIGTRLMLSFSPPPTNGTAHEPFKLAGQVTWINKVRANGDNPNPGMGIRFINLTLDDRERLVEVIRAICYLRAENAPS
jgi:type IV pilus assembly protein PilZ